MNAKKQIQRLNEVLGFCPYLPPDATPPGGWAGERPLDPTQDIYADDPAKVEKQPCRARKMKRKRSR